VNLAGHVGLVALQPANRVTSYQAGCVFSSCIGFRLSIVVAGVSAISSGWRTVVWTGALGTMGVACIVNALRCGRVHCYLTGPFFLLMALIALSYGLGMLSGGTVETCSA
jgi:hypothetical protein